MAVVLHASSWCSPPLTVAVTRRDRRRGLRPRAGGRSLLLRASAVHGRGMKEALWVAGLDRAGLVTEVRLLLPGHFISLPGASWVLEMAATGTPPPAGSVLTAARRRARSGL